MQSLLKSIHGIACNHLTSAQFNINSPQMMLKKLERRKLSKGDKSIAFILRSHPNDVIGGAEIQAWIIARNLAKRGWDVSYIYESPQRQTMPCQENGVRLYRLPSRSPYLSFLNYFALRRVMFSVKAMIYYQRGVCSYTGLTIRIAKRQGALSVWASSSLMLDCFPDQMQRQWKSRPYHRWGRLSCLPAWSIDRIAEYGIRNANQVIVQTQEQKEAIMHTWKRDSIVIPNAQPVPPLVSRKIEPPVIVWLGSIKSIKRPMMFVDLAKRCSEVDARFVMVGAPVESALSVELNKCLPGVPNISYLGPIAFEETNRLLQGATLLVNTSVGEGFSNTFIQAWLRNVPVVSFVDPDGVIDRNGLGVCVNTFEDLFLSVKKIVAAPKVIQEMGKHCRDYAIREHGLDRVMDLYDSLFTKWAE
jgi:glycosyltransferase involved in cell wall biosynthesis